MNDSADRARRHRPTATRALLQIAAFAAVQAVIVVGLAPFTPHIAAWFPPAYALVAFAQTLMIFAARRFVGLRWGATLAAVFTALVCGPFTAIGWLLAVPLVTAGALFDMVLAISQRARWDRRRAGRTLESAVAGLVIGVALFVVSLPVMSLDQLGLLVIFATLVARIIASWVGALLSALLVVRLERAGVKRVGRAG